MVMQRWDPFRELQEMDETMNRLWRGFGSRIANREAEDWNIALDVVRKPEEIVAKASLPGVKPEDIDVTIEDNVLTLKAQRSSEYENKDDTAYLIRERSYGSYYRALRLPESVDTEKVKSDYEHGVLTVTLPKMEEKKPKQIKVNVGGVKEIESTAKKK